MGSQKSMSKDNARKYLAWSISLLIVVSAATIWGANSYGHCTPAVAVAQLSKIDQEWCDNNQLVMPLLIWLGYLLIAILIAAIINCAVDSLRNSDQAN